MTTSPVLTPTTIGPLRLRNRVVKCATYETRCRDGLVTDALVDWHREFAAGGVAMTTLAYCSASADGRTFRAQIWMRPDAVPGLRRFTDAMHAEGAKAAIQIGHAGWFADPKADDSCLGAASPVTGFDGDASAGVQMMNSGDHLLP